MTEIYFDPNREINPHFYDVWTTDRTYNILSGGRNSFKSSVVSLKVCWEMVEEIAKGEKANVVVIRKVANTIKDSVFLKIQWVLRDKLGIIDQFRIRNGPYTITHKATGSTFYFYGQDDFQKLKSNDIGDIIAVWYEEAAEFTDSEEFDQSNITFMRQNKKGQHVKFYWTYNPPRNPFHWINEWSNQMESESDYLVDRSSYKDDVLGFADEMLPDIERIKRLNHNYYEYLYLGIPSRDENYFFPDIVIDNSEPSNEADYFLGIDSAYKGKDKVVASLCCLDNESVKVLDYIAIDKANWEDGITGKKVVNSLLMIINKYKVKMVCCDSGEGAYIIEGLAPYTDTLEFVLKGVSFGSGTTKLRQDKGHYAALQGYNMRAELHLNLQELMLNRKVTFTEVMKKALEEQMSLVTEEPKPNKKIKIIEKDTIKQMLGHSPDELDATLLAIQALVLHTMNTYTFFYTD